MSIKSNLFILLSLLAAMMLVVACGAQPEQAAQSSEQSQEAAAADEEHQGEEADDAHSEEEHAEDEHEHDEEAEAQSEEAHDETEHHEETDSHSEADHDEEHHDEEAPSEEDHHDEEAHSEEDHHDEEGHDDHADEEHHDHEHSESLEALIAELSPVSLAEGERLQVLASTSIVGDLVSNVAGESVDLSVLMPIGADLHSFEPVPSDLAAIADADVIFVIGLNAEEQLMESLENAGGEAVIVPVSTGIELLEFAEGEGHDHGHGDEEDHHEDGEEHHDDDEEEHHDDEEEHHDGEEEHHDDEAAHDHDHGGVDPHVWTTPYHAILMVHNIEGVLAALDPAQADLYIANAEAYEAQLEELDGWVQSQIETIPAENRELVTDHTVFNYYADRYGLTQVGTVIPSFSTSAEPSAQELAELQDAVVAYDVPAIFVGTTVNPSLSEQVAQDTGKQLLTIYTGSLGPAGSRAETFVDYIRYNTNAFVEGLSQP